MLKHLTIVILLALLSSCSHTNSSPHDGQTSDQLSSADSIGHFRVSEDAKEEKQAQKRPDQQVEELEDIPVEINANVNKWIDYFQNRGRVHMERYLRRSTRYESLMKKVLRDNKLPEDLFYIALIESGFSAQAFSHASAVGYWQFIRGTGKRYKLDINQLVDERRDPVLSTQAAADYFKDLYQRFDSWYLAMAAYNVGEGRVERVIKKYKTKDFWTLIKNRRALPAETANYVPKYIAAKLIAKNPDQYGFEGIDYMPPIEFDHVTLDEPVNLRLMAEKMNINYEDFKALNPKFKGEVAPLEKDQTLGLRIPPGSYEAAVIAAKESTVDKVVYIADQKEIQPYRVRKGDTFSTIARKYRTTVAYLRDINDFPRKRQLRAGQRIFVPDRTPLNVKRPSLAKKSTAKRAPVASKRQPAKYHIVKKGENLATIAKKYSSSVADIKKANNIKSRSVLKIGTKIVVPDTNKKL
ncbi:lytic transglycosylase domain-containing protein [Pseudobdellovibrio exovorus]|uniref:Membrane-bound lytic murein transglycosylase D n=1 Tax=Pseudobdellovibrio exovorus JSS TaxID=1184267 RepID=M4VAR1_9BACT|nr:lytic transglycosylase domain-containing protein [Pseudobdellovibrio exovorus]AGH95106.1 membrane-bound lytic murein transglycosylase D precursor [Pseudobdellovibrio exovorus JSS]